MLKLMGKKYSLFILRVHHPSKTPYVDSALFACRDYIGINYAPRRWTYFAYCQITHHPDHLCDNAQCSHFFSGAKRIVEVIDDINGSFV